MEKRGLGRGLSALIGDAPDAGAGQPEEISIDRIEPNPFQPRTDFDPAQMEELTESVRTLGILQPILLRRIGADRYQIVAGERRFRAAKAAGLGRVPALVRAADDRQMLEIALIENVQRADIGPIEAARAYDRLRTDFELTHEQIAGRVGKSRASITNALRLLELPPRAVELLESGAITEGHAKVLLGLHDENDLVRASETIAEEGLSVRAVERLVQQLRDSAQASAPDEPAPRHRAAISADAAAEKALLDALEQALGTRVRLRKSARGGHLEIEFYSSDDLARVAEVIVPGLQL